MKNNKTLLDIAILTSGRVDLFEKCVDAILTQMSPEYKIHVCNNGTPSNEYEVIYKKLPSGSTIKRLNQNGGFSIGANTAINSGSAPLVLFVSDDIIIQPNAIDELLKVMDDPTIAISGYKFTFPEDSADPTRPAGKIQHIGMASTISGEMVHPMMGWNPDNPRCNISRDVLAVTGASFIIRRAVFKRAGGFSNEYDKGYYEDMDLCFKIRNNGLGRVFVTTNATATHLVGQSYLDTDTRPLMQKNRMTFRAKWVHTMPWTEPDFY